MNLKEILSKLGIYVIIFGFMFLFLAMCNWGWNPEGWNGFSRVLLALFGIVPIILFFDDLKSGRL